MLDLSPDTIDAIHSIANYAAVIGAAIGLSGSAVMIWTGGVRDRLGAEKLEAALHTAADASALATRLDAHAAQRTLSPTQRSALVAALSPFRGQRVAFESTNGDAEAAVYKRDIASAFRESGWVFDDATLGNQSFFDTPPIGLQVTINQKEAQAGALPGALKPLLAVLFRLGLTDDEKKAVCEHERATRRHLRDCRREACPETDAVIASP